MGFLKIYYNYLLIFTLALIANVQANDINQIRLANETQVSNCSTLSDAECSNVKDKLAKFYQVPKPLKFENILIGVGNNVYFLHSDDKIISVIKHFSKKSYKDIQSICAVTEKLRKDGFPVPKVDLIIPTSDGRAIIASEHKDGKHKSPLSEKQIRELIKWMAFLHLNYSNILPKKSFNQQDIEWLFLKCKSWKHIRELEKIYKSINLEYLDQLPSGLIHGDFSYSNLLFDQHDNLSAILDFDLVCVSYLLNDLARFQIFYGFDKEGKLSEEKIKRFVKIYHIYRPLTDIEYQNFYNHLKLMIIEAALWQYYNVYVAKDTNKERFNSSVFNKDVSPEALFDKLLKIKDKSSL